MTWLRTGVNLLTVDRVTGGLAYMVGWKDLDDGATHASSGPGEITVDPDEGVSTSVVNGGVAERPLYIGADDLYVAGATFRNAAGVQRFGAVGIQWVFQDGQVSDPIYAAGYGRVFVVGQSPPNTLGARVVFFNPVARITDDTDAAVSEVTYWDPVYSAFRPYQFTTAWEDPEPIVVSGAVLARSAADPGALVPHLLDETLGTALYYSLPETYRAFDAVDETTSAGFPLRNFVQGACSPGDSVTLIADRIYNGELTDPVTVTDDWLPWLAAVTGTVAATMDDARHLLTTRQEAPAVGSRAALAVLARRWLSGTQVADVFPHPDDDWTIVVRVRADELGPAGGDAADLEALLLASGQIPVGHTVVVITGTATWDDVEARSADDSWTGMETSGTGPMVTWAELDSSGVSGL